MRLGIIDTIQTHYSALILDALHRTGVLKFLRDPHTPSETASACGVDVAMLAPLLAFVCTACTLIEHDTDGRFKLAVDECDLGFVAHMLDQYVGAYGPPLAAVTTLLREGRTGEALVDHERHAAAFNGDRTGVSLSEPARMILGLGATRIVELGCGGAQTLCELARANPEFTAIGIDSNPTMAASASARVRARGLAEQVEIKCGDALDVLRHTNTTGVQIVLASSLLNAFWRKPDGVAAFLRRLSTLLPGRLLLISDYYSHLIDSAVGRALPRTLIHDLAQLISGQGMPPASADGWAMTYAAVGAEFLHGFEASGDGIDRFIHFVRLPEEPLALHHPLMKQDAFLHGGPGEADGSPSPER